MNEQGILFSKVVVVIGFVTMISGTLGALWAGADLGPDIFGDSIALGVAFVVSNVLTSSLLFSIGAYIHERLLEVGREQTK